MEFVAIVVKHVDPTYCRSKKNLKKGVRDELAELFACDATHISHILKNVKDYLIIYKEFRYRVEYLYTEIFEK